MQLSGLCRPSGDFQPFESATLPPVPPMQAMPAAAPVPASTARVAPSSNVDLLGDLDLTQPSVPVQPNSFVSPPAVAQSSTFAMTVPVSGGVVSQEAEMTSTCLQPNALTAAASVPTTAPTATAMESVCFVVCLLFMFIGYDALS